jgi:hypothetical protein
VHRWSELAAEVAALGERRVFLSNENLAMATEAQAARAVTDLGGQSVHAVLVARALSPLLPSAWQQFIQQTTRMPPFEDWLRSVLGLSEPDGASDAFWRHHDLSAQVDRWAASAAAPDRVVVIVAREGDRNHLIRVFEAMLGLPPGLLDKARPSSNSSLSYTQAEFLRNLDQRGAELGWSSAFHKGVLKDALNPAVRKWQRDDDGAIVLPDWAADRVAELTERRIDFLASTGVRVVGDPQDLRVPVRTATPEERPGDPVVSVTVAAESVATAVQVTLDHAARRRESAVAKARRAAHRQPRRRQTPPLDQVSGRELAAALAARVRRRLASRGR